MIGAGAAGLMAAGQAGQRGRRVLLLEHTDTIGAKILISGGGRCNFTNLDMRPERFLSANPHFAKSALARYTQHDFIQLIARHKIAYYEKTLGQLFCEGVGAAKQIVALLVQECGNGNVDIRTGVAIHGVTKNESGFTLATSLGGFDTQALIIATGGLSIPKLGASDFAYRIAHQFDHAIIPPEPALTPMIFGPDDRAWMAPLSGVSVEAEVATGKVGFREGLLFTHRGLSGPSILQISSYWRRGQAIAVNFAPDVVLGAALIAMKRERPRLHVETALRAFLPDRLAQAFLAQNLADGGVHGGLSLAEHKDTALHAFGAAISKFTLMPAGDEGFAKAEVTRGGVCTAGLDQRTMQSRTIAGLHFIGECVDVTGWLGGYNFQWAWSSGWCAGQAV